LERNEKCIYIFDENTEEELIIAFNKFEDIQKYTKSNQIEFLSKEQTYLNNGVFDPEEMINLIKKFEQKTIEDGYNGLRLTGEMTWIFSNSFEVENLINYEAKLNKFLPQSKILTICQYSENEFTPDILLDVLATHPKIILNHQIHKNPNYIPPELFFARIREEIEPKLYMMAKKDILERKEIENRLKKIEEKYGIIHDASPIGITTSTLEGQFLSANAKAAKIFGYESVEEFISEINKNGIIKKLYLNPQDRESMLNSVTQSNEWIIKENQFLDRDGNTIILLVRSFFTTNSNGEQIIESYFEDTTERRKTEEELEEKVKHRTEQIELLYNIVRDVSHTFDLKESMKIIAKYISQIVEYDIISEILAYEGLNFIHIETSNTDKDSIDFYIEKLKNNLENLNPEIGNNKDRINMVKNDKEKFKTISSSISIPLIAEDKVVGFISIGSSKENAYREDEIWFLFRIADNISETLQRMKVVMSAKDELETVLEHSSDGIILLNREKQILLANQVGKEFLERIYHNVGSVLQSEIVDFDEIALFGRKEVIIENRIFIAQINDIKTDFVHGWLLSIHDVTEERELQRRIAHQERLATIGQLSGGIAHDFNNILASIIGAIDLVSSKIDDVELQDLLKLVLRQGERGASLVKQMLDFSRQAVVSPTPINIQPFLDDFKSVIRASIIETINIEFSIEGVKVLIDPVQLEQLLMNLILNSRDAIKDEGNITLSVKRVGSGDVVDFENEEINQELKYVKLQIKDDGIGMEREVLDRAFEPFFTTKETGKGSGLGLAQVYGIVRQSNGFINIKSDINKGTEVNIYLPEFTGEVQEVIQEEETNPDPGEGKILLVEDDDDVREITKLLLEKNGYNVNTASNGLEALDYYNKSYNLVITDIVMPIMGGVELIKELRKLNSSVRCLAITGYANIEVPPNIPLLNKPISKPRLIRFVKKIIDSNHINQYSEFINDKGDGDKSY
ncbi:MAG: MEDS domain-containing protein, partial [Candidatus Heimdallarchaeota archaeon]